MKIGIFGGTFNPPHYFHKQILLEAQSQLNLDKLIVVPSGMPYHKFCDVSKQNRLVMTKLAFQDIAEVSQIDIDRQGNTYTVDTLKQLKTVYPNDDLYFIIGGDSLRDFDKWHLPQEIVKLCTLAVAERADCPLPIAEVEQKYNCQIAKINVFPSDVSSSEIRLRYQFGLDNGALVDPIVDMYICDNWLYSKYCPLTHKLHGYLTEKRFSHTFYVTMRGLSLANEDEYEKVFLTCALHDCAKYIKPQDYSKYGFVKPSDMPVEVVHAFLGALVAEQDFDITDIEILDAIRYHCTARPNMTRLEKIVYVADKTEKTRPYPVEHLLKGSLDDMFKACLIEANEFCLTNHGQNVYYLTQQALDFYK